jgi:hypothetical protein
MQAVWAKRMSHGRGARSTPTIEVFGDRWTLLVLRDIVFGGRRYFRELQAGPEKGIASNIMRSAATCPSVLAAQMPRITALTALAVLG